MPTTSYVTWDNSWSPTSLAGGSISNGSSGTTGVISHNGKSGTEVGISIGYGATATVGAYIYILKEVNGTYEVVADLPWGFEMPKTVSTVHNKAISLDGLGCGTFKVHVVNSTGAAITATVVYRQNVIGQTTS